MASHRERSKPWHKPALCDHSKVGRWYKGGKHTILPSCFFIRQGHWSNTIFKFSSTPHRKKLRSQGLCIIYSKLQRDPVCIRYKSSFLTPHQDSLASSRRFLENGGNCLCGSSGGGWVVEGGGSLGVELLLLLHDLHPVRLDVLLHVVPLDKPPEGREKLF